MDSVISNNNAISHLAVEYVSHLSVLFAFAVVGESKNPYENFETGNSSLWHQHDILELGD